MVPLPIALDFIPSIDGLLITHTHFDHFDKKAKEVLPKDLPIYCSAYDVKVIKKSGFKNVNMITDSTIIYDDIKITAVKGRHGSGIVGKLMGKTTGYVLSDVSSNKTEATTYIVGDSIWCDHVSQAIENEAPKIIVAFTGEARLPFGKPITMTTTDIDQLATCSTATIVAIHMDTWNHCYLTRDGLSRFVEDKAYRERIVIPADGEIIAF